MTAKWKVCKRDGVWCAIDWEGDLRYASTDWNKTVAFALMGEPATAYNIVNQALRQQLIQWRRRMLGLDDE